MNIKLNLSLARDFIAAAPPPCRARIGRFRSAPVPEHRFKRLPLGALESPARAARRASSP